MYITDLSKYLYSRFCALACACSNKNGFILTCTHRFYNQAHSQDFALEGLQTTQTQWCQGNHWTTKLSSLWVWGPVPPLWASCGLRNHVPVEYQGGSPQRWFRGTLYFLHMLNGGLEPKSHRTQSPPLAMCLFAIYKMALFQQSFGVWVKNGVGGLFNKLTYYGLNKERWD